VKCHCWRNLSISRVYCRKHIWISLCFNCHFPGETGWAGVYWIKGWCKAAVVTTGAINHAELQSNHHHQKTNIQFFTGRMPFLSPNQQCQSTEWKNITFHGLAYHKLTWVNAECTLCMCAVISHLWCVLLVSAFLLSPWRHTKFDGYWSCQPIYRCVLLLESTFFACILCCMYYPHSLSDFFVKWVFVIQSLLLVSVVTLWLVLVIERSQVHTSAELLWCNKHALVPVWVSTGWAKINPTVLESR